MSKSERKLKTPGKNALVTGATGYIGSHLVRRLVKDGWKVTVLVRPSSDTRAIVRDYGKKVRVIVDDHPDRSLRRQLERARPDCVFHLAAESGTSKERRGLLPLVRSNVLLGVRLLEAMLECGAPCIVNTGSFWQFDREGDFHPNSAYAATKQAFEDILAYYAGTGQVRGTTLELFDVYGPEDPRGKLFPQLLAAMKTGRPLRMSPGRQKIDLVFIDDVVQAYLCAAELLEHDRRCGLRYSVTSGRPIELRQVVRRFEVALGLKIPVRWGGRPYRFREVMEPHRGVPLPGWKPAVTLEEGFCRLV